MGEGADAVTMVNAPKGCVLTIKRPDKTAAEGVQLLADDIAAALRGKLNVASTLGADFVGRVLVACP
jgi:hypothetical protein